MYATNVLKFAHYSCILLNYIQTCLVYRDRLKKNVLTLCLITQEIKKKTKKITLKIIGTIIKLKITGTYRFKISRDKYFPLKKNIENPWTPIAQTPTPTILITDLTTIHLTLINLRISNIETNMRTRQISLPPPAPSLFKPGNERHEWRKRFRKKNTVPPPRVSNLPPLPHLPFPFFSANLSAEKSPL